MSNSEDSKKVFFPKPIEIKIADAIFVKIKNNILLFKDLNKNKVHFSTFIIVSKIDFHLTFEDKDATKKHFKFLELHVDWDYLLEQIIQEVVEHRHTIFRVTKIDDPEIKDLEVDILQTQLIAKMFEKMEKKKRLNIDSESLNNLDLSQPVKIKEIAKYSWIGRSSDGQIIISDGKNCALLNFSKILNDIDKKLIYSIRKINLKYYTPKLLIWWIKIKLFNINRSAVNLLNKILVHYNSPLYT